MENTFNLGYVFCNRNGHPERSVIVVCHSENPIDRQYVGQIATAKFNQSVAEQQNANEIIRSIVAEIQEHCDCESVTVVCDYNCSVRRL